MYLSNFSKVAHLHKTYAYTNSFQKLSPSQTMKQKANNFLKCHLTKHYSFYKRTKGWEQDLQQSEQTFLEQAK